MTQAKRRLTDIKFEHEGAHVALVGVHQGGPANGVPTLVYKALNVPEDVKKEAGDVVVTLPFAEFLRKFFGMYWDDAEVLARALGFSKPDPEPTEYKSWIDERVETINILKHVYKSQDMQAALQSLTPQESLAILKAQALLENAMSSALPEGDLTTPPKLEDDMDKIEKALHEELVTKAVAQAEDVLKAQLSQQADVIKSLQDEVAVFKAEKEAAVAAARKAQLVEAGVTDEKLEDVFKAVGSLDDTAFAVIVKQFADAKAALDEGEMFVEKGVTGAGEPDQEEVDKTAEILKARYGK